MIKPQKPDNEDNRLKVLKSYQILDTLSEKDFDNLTALASYICDTPISLVSLVDDKRQWFKSNHGLSAKETPKDYAFCAHAINDPNNMFVIENSLKDKRFHDNPLVTGEPKVIFYAGIPLVSESGFPIGTLCVIDHKPKELKPEQKEALTVLGNQVMNLIELRKKNRVLLEKKEELEESKRLSLIGEFSAGIAHEINNPLAIIYSKAQLLDLQLSNTTFENENFEKITHSIESIKETALHCSDLIKNLNEFSSKPKFDKMDFIDLSKVIDIVLKMSQERCQNEGIKLTADFDKTVKLKCNSAGMSQVILNLINNSIDAIQNLSDKWIKIESKITDSILEIIVSDSGMGISNDLIEKITQPFFTTKDPGKGTGLGLSIAAKTTERMNGNFYYNSNSKNTQFVIQFKSFEIN